MDSKLTKKRKAQILIGILRNINDTDNHTLDIEVSKNREFIKMNIKLILRRKA